MLIILTGYRPLVSLICLLLATGLAMGSYPAFIASRLKPSIVLYSKLKLSGKNTFSKFLIVIQFGLAIVLVSIAVIFQSQFNLLVSKNLGYDDKNVMEVELPYKDNNIAPVFKNNLLKNGNILRVAARSEGLYINGAKTQESKDLAAAIIRIDDEYKPVLHIPILQGRNFSRIFVSDTSKSIIVNESLPGKQAGLIL